MPRSRARTLTITARVLVFVIALVVGGYLFREGQVSRHLSNTAAVNPPPSIPASPSAAADPSASASPPSPSPSPSPSPDTQTPAASATALPPVAAAPAIVQAIDHANVAPPLGYSVEGFSAASLGTAAGFTIAMPPGWRSTHSKQDVTLAGPDGRSVEIDLTAHAKSDLVAQAEYLSATRRADFPGYGRIYGPPDQPPKKFFQPAAIRQTLGALWEFDWITQSNVQLREDVLLFSLDGQSYTIYAAGPAGQHDRAWNHETLGIVSSMLRTFTPALS